MCCLSPTAVTFDANGALCCLFTYFNALHAPTTSIRFLNPVPSVLINFLFLLAYFGLLYSPLTTIPTGYYPLNTWAVV